MTTVTRSEFERLATRGGYIDVDRMSPTLRETFHRQGITDEELDAIAGQDHVIRGKSEFRRLFNRLDELDRNGSSTSIETGRSNNLTRAGQVYQAIRNELDVNRERIDREGGQRFANDRTLQSVRDGRAVLEMGSHGEHVRKVQQALIDIGMLGPNGATGEYDRETRIAVERFQRETGLSMDGKVGRDTLHALAAAAPPPGRQLERRAEFDRLYRDGRLDVTIAVGYDEHGTTAGTERNILSGLRAQGYRPLNVSRMSADQRQRLGLSDDRYDPNARYFCRRFIDPETNQPVDAVVRLITPGSDGARARRSFEQAMRQDEVVFYAGHARYGTGPDFDPIDSGRGNFVIDPRGNRRADAPPAGLRDSIRGRRSELPSLDTRPEYQLLVFNACSTEEYLNNLRDPQTFGRTHQDTDIIGTTMPSRLGMNGQHAVRFLQGLTSRESNNSMLGAMSQNEQAYLRRINMNNLVDRASHFYTESGFLTNSGNRTR
jgi:peptidoglycan hydrolase-like protein with peptidoglycan-binding domain